MKLTPRLTLTFALYAAALLGAVALLAYRSGRDSLRAATISELQTTAIEKQGALDQWVDEKRQDIARLAADPAALVYAAALRAAAPGTAQAQSAHDQLLAEVFSPSGDNEFVAVMVIDPISAQVIASTDPSEEGKYKEDRPFFLQGRTEPVVQNLYYSIALQSPAMTAAAPLIGPRGDLLGVLAGRLDLGEMNDIVNRRTGLHQTDEAFLVNTSNLFVTQPRFVADPAVLRRGVHTEAVSRCLGHDSGAIEADDYRGVPSFIIYTWMPDRELCLIVKIDEAEAIAPARSFGAAVGAISGLALVAAGALAVVLARSITRPVLALQAGAQRFGQGELSVRLPESSRDELGALAREFNRMAESLAEKDARLRSSWRTTQARLERLADSNVIGIAVAGAAGEVFEANDYYLDLLGYTRADLEAGQVRWIDMSPPEHLAADRRALAEMETTGACTPYDKEYFRKDGTRVWVTITDAVLPQEGGKILALVQEITERKQAEAAIQQSEERYRTLFESMVNGYAFCRMLTEDGKPSDFAYIRVNKEFERLTGLRDVEGRKVSEVVPGIQSSNPELFEIYGRVAQGGAPERFETYVGALERWFDVSVYCPSRGHFVAVFDNITNRKRIEAEGKDYASTLERRVAERTAELEAFSYSVSHDLRAPLRAIDGFSRILQEDHGAALDERAQRYLTLVRGGTQRMGHLIDDLLAFSRLGRQELVRRPVRMAGLALQALEELKEERAGRQLDVTIDDLPEAFADPGLLRQVFANLLSNALKFTRTRTPARIHVGSTRENGETVFFVEDNGVGFDMAFVGKLFGVFQRLHRQEDYEGTGVGLAIVQQVVRRHGGRVWAQGGVDQGATFFFVLPEGNEP